MWKGSIFWEYDLIENIIYSGSGSFFKHISRCGTIGFALATILWIEEFHIENEITIKRYVHQLLKTQLLPIKLLRAASYCSKYDALQWVRQCCILREDIKEIKKVWLTFNIDSNLSWHQSWGYHCWPSSKNCLLYGSNAAYIDSVPSELAIWNKYAGCEGRVMTELLFCICVLGQLANLMKPRGQHDSQEEVALKFLCCRKLQNSANSHRKQCLV